MTPTSLFLASSRKKMSFDASWKNFNTFFSVEFLDFLKTYVLLNFVLEKLSVACNLLCLFSY